MYQSVIISRFVRYNELPRKPKNLSFVIVNRLRQSGVEFNSSCSEAWRRDSEQKENNSVSLCRICVCLCVRQLCMSHLSVSANVSLCVYVHVFRLRLCPILSQSKSNSPFLAQTCVLYLVLITWLCFNSLKLLKTKRRPLYLKTQFVPRSKHFSSQL